MVKLVLRSGRVQQPITTVRVRCSLFLVPPFPGVFLAHLFHFVDHRIDNLSILFLRLDDVDIGGSLTVLIELEDKRVSRSCLDTSLIAFDTFLTSSTSPFKAFAASTMTRPAV